MDANIQALQNHPAGPATLARYVEVARILTGNPSATALDGVQWVHDLCAEFQIPPLRQAGLTTEACTSIIPAAQRQQHEGQPGRTAQRHSAANP